LSGVLLGACPEGPGDRPVDAGFPDLPPFNFPEAGDVIALEPPPAGSDQCHGAITVALTGGKALVKGTTSGAINEFGDKLRCGEATGLPGPQRYYKVQLSASTTYRLQLKPQFEAVLYLFVECSQTLINVDCASGGATGLFSGLVASGATKTMFFEPTVTGTHYIAVDSASSSAAGAFELQVEAIPAATHGSCSSAKELKLSSGAVNVVGSTLGAKNEYTTQISCNTGLTFKGPQVYYKVALAKGGWYRVALSPEFPASLYLVNNKGNCKAQNIETDCSSITGTVLPTVAAGATGATAFSPLSAGDYLVVVDSLDPKEAGAFKLSIESYTPPGNMTCGGATSVVLLAGQGKVSGTTASFLNDLGAHVTCGKGAPLVAPQSYFKLDLEQKTYQLALKPSFSAALAVGSSCLTLPVDCGSAGLSGALLSAPAGQVATTLFTAPKAGAYLMAVDGTSAGAAGAFELQISEYLKPTNGVCASPRALALGASPAKELGDTSPLKNDLAGVACGSSLGPWPGAQAYYKVSLKGGTSYTVTLTPEAGFDPALYAFPAGTACTAAAVNSACTGAWSDNQGAGKVESLKLAPSADTDYVLVVDAWSASEIGTFELKVSW
jgi:hypothetical protein